MAGNLDRLLANNKAWAKQVIDEDPEFFARLAKQQKPEYLWIGCSDSRVPANQISGLLPGEVFVHRNVANIVMPTDLNCVSVIEYAVEVLKVRHIIVCGHYQCGGVKAAMEGNAGGNVHKWLADVRALWNNHKERLQSLSPDRALTELCELNVALQMTSVCKMDAIKQAWQSDQPLSVHGWIYAIEDGLLKDLGATVSNEAEYAELLTP
jgi:carbonic anhydrase